MSGFQGLEGSPRLPSGPPSGCGQELLRHKQLDPVLPPEVKLLGADARQQSVIKEELSEHQEWSPSLEQEDTKPPLIKEELEEADMFPFTVVTVKSEEDEEESQSSELRQIQTELTETGADGEDCGAEQFGNSDSEMDLQPEIEVMIEDSSGPETDGSDDCRESRKRPSGLNTVKSTQDKRLRADKQIHDCSECGKRFNSQGNLIRHMVVHTGEKPFSCSDCGKRFSQKQHLTRHKVVHTGEKPFSCPDCGKRFTQKVDLTRHLANHREEKLFSCSECGKGFIRKSDLTAHMVHHTEEEPFSCSECGKGFYDKRSLTRHMLAHSGERPYICSVCSYRFKQQAHLTSHMYVHSGEKPFSCSECSKRFYRKWHLTSHMLVHTRHREKRFSCRVCDQTFSWFSHLKKHRCVKGQASEFYPNYVQEERALETGVDGVDCGESVQAGNSDLEGHLQPETEIKIEDSAELENEDIPPNTSVRCKI